MRHPDDDRTKPARSRCGQGPPPAAFVAAILTALTTACSTAPHDPHSTSPGHPPAAPPAPGSPQDATAPPAPPAPRSSPPPRALPAVHLLPARTLRGTYEVSHPEKPNLPPRRVPFTFAPQGAAQWRLPIEGISETHFTVESDGRIVVSQEIDFGEGVRVEYSPPLEVLPARLRPETRSSGRSEMVVTNLADGVRRDQGDCDYEVVLSGWETVDSPVGSQRAFLVRTTRTIDLQLADAEVKTESAYAPGEGVLRETVDQLTTILGLFPVRKVQTYRRVE